MRSFHAMLLRGAACLLALLAMTAPARAELILDFAQKGTANTTIITATGGTSTTITNTDTAVSIDAIGAALVTPFDAFYNFSAHSTSPASTVVGISQHFSGTFSLTSLAGGLGTNYLSGTFNDIVLGNPGGTFLILGASTPPPTDVTFTSSVISSALLGEPRSLALSFTAVSPAVHLDGTTLGSGTASVSGDFSAVAVVPEPSTVVLAATGGLVVVGYRLRRRRAIAG
jgi:hypothetical protein